MVNILEYKKLTYKFASKYRKYDMEDGIQDGFVALLDSANSFDKGLGYKFITHAYKRVMGHVMYRQNKRVHNEITKNYVDNYKVEDKVLFIQLNKFLSKRETDILIDISIYELGLEELSKKYKISKQRIHQIYKNAIEQSKIHLQQ